MSTLKTHNLQSPDAASANIALTPNAGMVVAGISTFSEGFAGDVIIDDKIVHRGDTNNSIRFPAADTITAETAGSERLRIDSSGRVLIGTTTPTSFADDLIVATSGDCGITIMSGTTHNGRLYFSDSGQEGDGFVDYDHQFGNLKLGTRDITRFTIDSNGNMALGGTPITSGYTSFTIHESGTNSGDHVRFNMTNGNTGNTGSDGFSITVNGSTQNVHFIQRETADMVFQTAGSERVRIGSAGQLGIAGANYGDAGQVLKSGGSGAAPTWGAGGNFTSYAIIAEIRSGNNDAGTLTANTWMTRAINTEIADPDGIVSISSNQFTLQAGTYLIEWSAPAWRCDRHTTRLYDVTNSAARGNATLEFSQDSGSYTQSSSRGFARVTISGATVYKLETKGSVTKSGDGLGIDPSGLASCIYAMAKIYKEV